MHPLHVISDFGSLTWKMWSTCVTHLLYIKATDISANSSSPFAINGLKYKGHLAFFIGRRFLLSTRSRRVDIRLLFDDQFDDAVRPLQFRRFQ